MGWQVRHDLRFAIFLLLLAVPGAGCLDSSSDDDALTDDDASDDDTTDGLVSSTSDWVGVSAGRAHACGVRGDGSILCWGCGLGLQDGQCDAPDGDFVAVSSGSGHTCALLSSGLAQCWGCEHMSVDDACVAPSETFEELSVWGESSYGRRVDGIVINWGTPAPPGSSWVFAVGQAGPLDSHNYTICSVANSHHTTCWVGYGPPKVVPTEQVDEIGVGGDFVCAIKTDDGSLTCWGCDSGEESDYGACDAPEGEYSQVDAGSYHACGLKVDGTVVCWGCQQGYDFGQCASPNGTFSRISAGSWSNCAVRDDGSVVCWGCLGTHPDSGGHVDAGQCAPP